MFKIKKIRSKKHRMFIASLPCLICTREDVQAAHIRYNNGGGMGMKPCDSYCVPLCVMCHLHQHNVGEVRFWEGRIEETKQLARKLYDLSGSDCALVEISEWRKK